MPIKMTYQTDEEFSRVESEVEEYLRDGGASFDYIRITPNRNEIQIKSPGGLKVIFTLSKDGEIEVLRC